MNGLTWLFTFIKSSHMTNLRFNYQCTTNLPILLIHFFTFFCFCVKCLQFHVLFYYIYCFSQRYRRILLKNILRIVCFCRCTLHYPFTWKYNSNTALYSKGFIRSKIRKFGKILSFEICLALPICKCSFYLKARSTPV